MAKFSKATKVNSFLKLGLAGPPGSGKSYSALNIATRLSEKRVAVIDAELGAASKYAHLFDFDVCELTLDDNDRDIDKPFSPQRYIEVIKAAYESGLYDVLIIDGISPEWDDAGGCLQWVDQITRNNDTRSAWKVVTPAHKNFINYILRVRMHVICTMLAKKEIVVEKDAHGKSIGKKVTLEPVQRADVPQVFDVFANMQGKDMIIDKTRCPELDDQIIHKPGQEVADMLREWLKGDPMPERPDYDPDASRTVQAASKPVVQAVPVSPTKTRLNAVYDAGKGKALWSGSEGMLNFVVALTGINVTKDTIYELPEELLGKLEKAVEEESASKAS